MRFDAKYDRSENAGVLILEDVNTPFFVYEMLPLPISGGEAARWKKFLKSDDIDPVTMEAVGGCSRVDEYGDFPPPA